MKTSAIILAALLLTSCAGVNIRPVSPADVKAAHEGTKTMRGYIVYAPTALFSVTETCSQALVNGACPGKLVCTVSNPIMLPDFTRPFVVDIQAGFGKAGADVQISDGWRLAGVKDTSDNTALLTFLQKVTGIGIASTPAAGCPAGLAGLYQWTPEGQTKMTKIFPP